MHRTGQPWLTTWTPDKVASAPDPCSAFIEYVQQVLGVPWSTIKDETVLRKRIAEFFEHYPKADFHTLCRVVQWCKSQRLRFTRAYFVIDKFRDAWAAGALPELDVPNADDALEVEIARALTMEADETWRARLIGTAGVDLRRSVFDEWATAHGRGPQRRPDPPQPKAIVQTLF
jgi:hypothetical protein